MVETRATPRTISPRVFVLEDADERIKWFQSRYPNSVIVSTVDDAIAALSREDFDIIFLDRDLSILISVEGYMSPGVEPTGEDVVDFLVANPDCNRNTRIIVHSLNSRGDLMTEVLLKHGRYASRCQFTILRQLV